MAHNADVTAAAELAVEKVFYLLGVNVHSAKSIEEFREDLRFGRKLRRMADHGTRGMIGIFMVGLAAALWHGIVSLVRVK